MKYLKNLKVSYQVVIASVAICLAIVSLNCFDYLSKCFNSTGNTMLQCTKSSEFISPWVQIFFSLVVGAIALGLTYKQYLLDRNKLKLDLYSKRFAIYNSLKDYINGMLSETSVDLRWNEEIKLIEIESKFLFNDEITSLIDSIEKLCSDLNCQRTIRIEGRNTITPEELKECCAIECEAKKEIYRLKNSLADAFYPYLNFTTHL